MYILFHNIYIYYIYIYSIKVTSKIQPSPSHDLCDLCALKTA